MGLLVTVAPVMGSTQPPDAPMVALTLPAKSPTQATTFPRPHSNGQSAHARPDAERGQHEEGQSQTDEGTAHRARRS